MRLLSRLFIISISVAMVISCSEELKPTPYTYTKLFTGENNKTWKVKIWEETLDGKVIDRFLPDCIVDDKFIFHAHMEHSYEAISGSRKCRQASPEAAVTNDYWSYNGAKATLTMVLPIFTDNPLAFIVREADEDDMKIEIFLDEANTSSYRIHFEAIDEE